MKAPRIGIYLALGTALISGISVFLNGFAVRQFPDPATYTTLKNAVAAVILIGAFVAIGGVQLAARPWYPSPKQRCWKLASGRRGQRAAAQHSLRGTSSSHEKTARGGPDR